MHTLLRFIFGHPILNFSKKEAKTQGQGFYHNGQQYIHHSTVSQHESAFRIFSSHQILFIAIVIFFLIVSLSYDLHASLVSILGILTTLYFLDLLFNLYLIYRSFSNPIEIKITDKEIKAEHTWPRYTILCPLYKEMRVFSQFLKAMNKLEYPHDKLQIMLLLEEDDIETIQEVRKLTLPSYFEVVIVPDSKPKTKPKACNYGLLKATGEYIVVYDAEDVPDIRQLKKSVLGFKKAGPKTVCIQAKLNFYNPHQNLISKIFTSEYSMWFELVLTGLQSIHAPIPLGGTSNHFRKKDLLKLKGWDSFNVTEDCDLGIRLVKQGYQTAIIDSLTLEEANSNASNWFEQRTRWIKGYMQTYLVHMRRPQEFVNSWKEPHLFTFQLIVGGKVLSMLINPIMWTITISYFAFRAHVGPTIESLFPNSILYMALLSISVGNFLYLYYYIIGCAKHGHFGLVKYAFLVPLYWLAMSVAAWVALYRLIAKPHYWSKTRHGLHIKDTQIIDAFSLPHPAVSLSFVPSYQKEQD